MAFEVVRGAGDGLERRAQTLEAFKIYRISKLVEVLDRPRLFAFVDGLVVDSHATVVSADVTAVVLEVDRAQFGALYRSDTLLLESPLHGTTYRATVDDADRERVHVSICRLEPFDAYCERRAQNRAVPRWPLLARVSGDTGEAAGRVVDVSTRSLAADFDPKAFARLVDAPSLELDVWGEPGARSPLPDFETEARILRHTEHVEGGVQACRAVLEFEPYPALEHVLRRYVARRQREILTELRLAGGDTIEDPLPVAVEEESRVPAG